MPTTPKHPSDYLYYGDLALFFDCDGLKSYQNMENSKDKDQQNVHHDKAREEEVVRQRKQASQEAENADRELRGRERSEMDASHGEDAIEIERNEGRRFEESKAFSPFHGDLGDESEDVGDLPPADRKNKNFYNAAASVGENQEGMNPEDAEAMRIRKGRKAGVSFKEKDSYVDEKDPQENRKE